MKRCDGIDRREFLRVGSLPALGLGLATAMPSMPSTSSAGEAGNTGSAKNCIMIWLDGGPSHLDTFDLKPEAPVEVRGQFKPISSNVPGIQICEHFSKLSKLIDKTCIIRSLTSELGVHGLGSHYLLTGYKPSPVIQYPSFGSVVANCQTEPPIVPPYIALRGSRIQAGNTLGNGYLPSSSQPFVLEGDPSRTDFRVKDLRVRGGYSGEELGRRRQFLQDLDRLSEQVEKNAIKTGRDAQFEQAYRLIFSKEAKQAFDLSSEKRAVRDNYGLQYNRRTRIGQSCLLARRLIQAGCRFVTVTDSGWDMHGQIYNQLERKLPPLDQAIAALIQDLDSSGLLQETLVLVMGEFGRTPRVNAAGGRDHWPRAFSMMMAGAGVKSGQVIGKSTPRGFSPAERPVTPTELARTIFTLLGINPNRKFHTSDGRPVLVSPGGKVIDECLA